MKPATLEYLKQKFAEYYESATISVPPALIQREWGFALFSSDENMRMRRHMAFTSKDEVENYLRAMVPRHVYYSTAYYTFPAGPTMQEKGWTGADLIFDLDADHIVHGDYDKMLERVRIEALKLIDMLTDELGFSKQDLSIVFSGGRGYHIHIRDLAVREWGRAERREMVDYVCGIGIEPDIMLSAGDGTSAGWRRRYRDAVLEELRFLKDCGKEDGVKALASLTGISSEGAGTFYEKIPALVTELQNKDADLSAQYRNERAFKVLLSEANGRLTERIRERAALTDEPVTTDTKRLIRMPGSLHGGSGFRVVPVSARELETFDPLTDAVVFGESPVTVDAQFDLKMPILGNDYTLSKGTNTVPEALAIFLCARGIAEIGGR